MQKISKRQIGLFNEYIKVCIVDMSNTKYEQIRKGLDTLLCFSETGAILITEPSKTGSPSLQEVIFEELVPALDLSIDDIKNTILNFVGIISKTDKKNVLLWDAIHSIITHIGSG